MRDELLAQLWRWHQQHDPGDHWPEFLEILVTALTDLEEELYTVQREMIHLKAQVAAMKQAQ